MSETEWDDDDIADEAHDDLGFDDPEALAEEIEDDEAADPDDETLKDIKGG